MCATPKGSNSAPEHPLRARLATPPPPGEGLQAPGGGGVSVRVCDPPTGGVHIICESSEEQRADNNAKNRDRDTINEINKARSTEGGGGAAHSDPPIIAPRNSNDTKDTLPQGPGANTAAAGGVNLRPGGEGAMALNNYETERLLRQLRRRLREADWAWLSACNGVVEGNYEPVEAYLSAGRSCVLCAVLV